MDEFGCDYACKTVGEGITKYHIPDEWWAEFDVYDDIYPIIAIPVEQIRKAPAMMDLKLRMIEKPEDEYAGCIILTENRTIAFKVDYMSDLENAIKGTATEHIIVREP